MYKGRVELIDQKESTMQKPARTRDEEKKSDREKSLTNNAVNSNPHLPKYCK